MIKAIDGLGQEEMEQFYDWLEFYKGLQPKHVDAIFFWDNLTNDQRDEAYQLREEWDDWRPKNH